MSGEVWEVWGAYHERERLCPEGVRVREIAHVHYGSHQKLLLTKVSADASDRVGAAARPVFEVPTTIPQHRLAFT